MEKKYDLIIIGSGPAGISAGIYAARYNLNFIIFGKVDGGTVSEAHKICNYPSQNNISGYELTQKMTQHLKELGSNILHEEIKNLQKYKDHFLLETNKKKYFSKNIILATGRNKIRLGVLGETEFLGKGVSYCATCDGGFYKNQIVAVVGGGNSAVTAALLLSQHAKKVYIIHRRDNFSKAEPAWRNQLEKDSKIKPIFNSNIKEIKGKGSVESVLLDSGKEIKIQGVFIEIGSKPDDFFINKLNLENEKGYIIVNKSQKTNVKGVYAAGDITNNSLKQIITASAEGAIAATSVYESLKLGG